ncbi:MAG: hypothetical protein CMI02_01355 [Oceanospirillaceae bacterium]|nr:hypothetical protein [Oceanospirillaceae bacterium]MBT10665.1 hypothetical protein [Oceanospirillaceae bacterium]|tara:strand:- start:1209 stop:1898 length:690 start_codon:yes stop_codon:yes gene_type:complete
MNSDCLTAVIDTAALERVGGGLGSNPAGIYQDAAGQRYYVKETESVAHARNEYIAAMLYQLAGAPTLRYVKTKNRCQVATLWCDLEKKNIARFTASERRQARHWFAVHCWTANWDAAGFQGDNQGVANGRVLTLDTGGALSFRAQGDPKGKAFGVDVPEWFRLRSDPDNPQAVRLFGDITAAEMQASLCCVTTLHDQAIRQMIQQAGGSDRLVAKMIARKAWLMKITPD